MAGTVGESGCLKVVVDTDQTWANLNKLGEDSSPVVETHERFQIHSWMLPNEPWAVIYPYEGEKPDTTFPIYQVFWSSEKSMVWERRWSEMSRSYDVYRTKVDTMADGPTVERFEAKGCIFATGTHSILADREWLKSGKKIDESNGYSTWSLARSPNLPIIPPDPNEPGYWLDVISDGVERDDEPKDPERLHRRTDYMLLARDASGRPELREWRTIVTADRSGNGRFAYRIVETRRFQYEFRDDGPPELATVTSSFVRDVDRDVGSGGEEQGH